MPNRLAGETSLYLRQHADNPVDWYPWGEEALARAKTEDKPLLVSVGYSSCHWCHVMAHESFENDYIAGLMNKHFVCVKIDREERPDLDQIFMEAVQMIARQGGWPLHVFCLPDGRPFFGGTYFPPEDRGNGMVPWPQMLMRVSDFYRRDRARLEENASAIVHNLAAMNAPLAEEGSAALDRDSLEEAAAAICRTHDDDFGGFGEAPKFPPSSTLSFLLEVRRGREGSGAEAPVAAERLDNVLATTLSAMAHGGLFDQIGGGFTRYSVDRYWLIPHFEKMLYDNGLLLDLYARAWRRYPKDLYAAIIEETAAWADREMLGADGLFFASLDADSEGEEGKFYVWTPTEVAAVLGEERGRKFCQAYHITADGNFEHGTSNPALVAPSFEERLGFAGDRVRLLTARARRVRPGCDEKKLVSWNSLFIRGLAEAAFSLDHPEYFARAAAAADAIWAHARFAENRLYSVVAPDGAGKFNGYLDDYAFYAEACLSLAAWADFFARGTSAKWIARAEAMAEAVMEHFHDPAGPGFFFTSADHERLIARRKEWWDNAIPSGNSALLHVFSSLHALTGRSVYGEQFARLRRAYEGYARRAPTGVAHALAAIAGEQEGIAVLKVKAVGNWIPLAEAIRQQPWRRLFVLASDDPAQPAGYQLCLGPTCRPPVERVEDIFRE